MTLYTRPTSTHTQPHCIPGHGTLYAPMPVPQRRTIFTSFFLCDCGRRWFMLRAPSMSRRPASRTPHSYLALGSHPHRPPWCNWPTMDYRRHIGPLQFMWTYLPNGTASCRHETAQFIQPPPLITDLLPSPPSPDSNILIQRLMPPPFFVCLTSTNPPTEMRVVNSYYFIVIFHLFDIIVLFITHQIEALTLSVKFQVIQNFRNQISQNVIHGEP